MNTIIEGNSDELDFKYLRGSYEKEERDNIYHYGYYFFGGGELVCITF